MFWVQRAPPEALQWIHHGCWAGKAWNSHDETVVPNLATFQDLVIPIVIEKYHIFNYFFSIQNDMMNSHDTHFCSTLSRIHRRMLSSDIFTIIQLRTILHNNTYFIHRNMCFWTECKKTHNSLYICELTLLSREVLSGMSEVKYSNNC